MKTKFMAGASALTMVMIAPGVASAVPVGTCGAPNTSTDPNVASCISTYTDGIVYDQSISGTPANLKVDLYGNVVVTTSTVDTGVDVTGSADHDAIIGARNGSRVTGTVTGLRTQTSGSGNAVIENHGTVNAGALGALAGALGTGTATITNASDGTVTVTQAAGSTATVGAGLVIGGTNGSVLNQGAVIVTSVAASGNVLFGIAGVGQGGGTIALSNANKVTVTTGDADAIGIGTLPGSGNVTATNSGTLSVSSGAGSATGFLALGNGTTGTTGLTNTGAFSVTSTGGAAVGMSASQRSDVAMVATRTSAASTFNVSGVEATGFEVTGATGAVSVAGTGQYVHVTATGDATGVSVDGGTTQTVSFVPATVGGTAYSGDLDVSGGGEASGVVLSGATDAVSVGFTGAGLTVTSTGAGARGIDVTDGSSVNISVLPGSGNGASLVVSAAGGDATGITTSGATGAQTVTLGDLFRVTNSAGSATGISLEDGTDQTVSLAYGATVTGSDGGDGISLSRGTGALSVTSSDALSVDGGTGAAHGVTISGGTSQQVDLVGALTVHGAGVAYGVEAYNSGGNVAITASDTISVTSLAGDANGALVSGGTDVTADFAKGLNVQAGGNAVGVSLADGTGTATLHLPAALSVTSTGGTATGILGNDGNALLIDGAGAITSTGSTSAYGVKTAGFTGSQTLVLGDVTASTQTGEVFGVSLDGSGAISLTDSGRIAAGAASGTGAGISLAGTGANGAITASLADVRTSGDGVQGVILAQTGNGATGAITATLASVSTTGADASGVTVRGADAGTVSLLLGGSATSPLLRAVAVDHSGGVSTQGDNANGVNFIVANGAGSLTNRGTITTLGANSVGIAASATGTGSIAIDSWNVTTGGAGSDGITVSTGSGAQTLTVQTVAVTGSGARGVVATSGSGAITLASTNVSATGGDAISLTSATGDVSATLLGGGSTISKSGAGLAITTGGSATVTQASTAALHGVTYGLVSNADGGQTVVLSGTVGADSNHAVALSGGAATLTNNGTINGYMTFDTASTMLTNAGTWNAQGGNSTFAGNATVINSGTLNVNAAAAAAATMKLSGVTAFRNSGTISLVNGHAGDVLDLGDAAFVGSGNSRVVLEANLGASAVGGNAAQSADQLSIGAASGKTTIVIEDLSGNTSAQFNFGGIRLVNATSIAAGAFVLEGDAVHKGFVDYQLLTDANGNVDLVGVPSTQAFELVRTGAEVRHYWRRSGDAWAEQMRAIAPNEGVSLWGQFLGGSETNRSRPGYSETVMGTAMAFTPNLDLRDTWWGGQFGVDWGHGSNQNGDWGVGVTGGYVSQDGKVKSTGDHIKLNGGNVGLYARYRSAQGFFAHALAKLDRYSVKYDLGNGASAPKTNGTSYGVEIAAGYHIRTGLLFLEPSASASWSNADLDGFGAGQGGVGAKFDHVQSIYGRAGLRAGVETHSGNWAIQPYVGVNWEGEMNGRPGATLSSGGEDLYFRDASEGGRARWELGVQGSSNGLGAFAKVEGVTGSGSSGVAGRAGVSFRF